jgi:hypothetical protein
MSVYNFNNVKYPLAIKVAILLYVFISLLSIANTYISVYGGGIIIYIIYFIPVLVILSYLIRSNIFNGMFKVRTYIMWMIAFMVIYVIFFQFISTKHEYIKYIAGIKVNTSVLHLINIIPVGFMSWYILQYKDRNFNTLLAVCIISIFTVNYLLTLKGLESDPLAVRTLATGEGGEEYLLAGVSGFDITYSAVMLIPCFLYLILSFSKIKRTVLIAFFVLTCIYIVKCAFSIAVLATLLGICIFLYVSVRTPIRILLAIAIIFICILAIDQSFIIYILNIASDIIDVGHVKRLKAVADMIMFGDTTSDELLRLARYKMSIDGFIENPISGIYVLDRNYILSGHSTILDILAGCGLMGFVPFFMFLYYSYKYSIKYVHGNMYKQCIISTYIVFAFIATLNPQLASPNVLLMLLVIIPVMCSTTEMNGERTNIRANNSPIGPLRRRATSMRPRTVTSN